MGFSSDASSYSTSAWSYLAAAAKAAGPTKCSLEARDLGAIERGPCVRRRRGSAARLCVFDDGAVVVLALFGVVAAARRWQAQRRRAQGDRDAMYGSAPCRRGDGGSGLSRRLERGVSAITSTPRGILNVNSLSASPTFSFRFVNSKLDVPPCASIVTRPRMASVAGSTARTSQS